MKKTTITSAMATLLITVLISCNSSHNGFDASGSFEADEYIISAEAQGILKEFTIEEGQVLAAGQKIGHIDSTQLYLKKKQLEAQIVAMLGRKPNISLQLSALQDQLKAAEVERERVANLVRGDAATPKQLDDANAQIDVLKSQIEAHKSTLNISSESINKEVVPIEVQIEQLADQLDKCTIINPTSGTVLVKYAKENEMTAMGKPLYKIADISNIILRVYVSGDQLPEVRLNQTVDVMTDDGKGGYNIAEGTVAWISDKAEFTPKTIQTKNERANLVYAVKVAVKNDGLYKIGMYGEIKFK